MKTCKYHPSRRAQWYCDNCDANMCQDCVIHTKWSSPGSYTESPIYTCRPCDFISSKKVSLIIFFIASTITSKLLVLFAAIMPLNILLIPFIIVVLTTMGFLGIPILIYYTISWYRYNSWKNTIQERFWDDLNVSISNGFKKVLIIIAVCFLILDVIVILLTLH